MSTDRWADACDMVEAMDLLELARDMACAMFGADTVLAALHMASVV